MCGGKVVRSLIFNLQHIACALAITSPFISKLIGKIMEEGRMGYVDVSDDEEMSGM